MSNVRLDWIEASTDVAKLQSMMERAKKLGNDEAYWRAFRRRCEVEGLDHSDPLHRDFHAMLAAYEQLLSEKNGKNTKANRTRQKLKNKGVVRCLEEWATSPAATMGFELLTKNQQAHLTGEYLVIRYSDKFTPEAVANARRRLSDIGVELPLSP